MVDKIGPLIAIKPHNFGDRPPDSGKAIAAAAPRERAQTETFFSDPITVRANPGRDDDIEAVRSRGACDRQSVRTEIPIFRDEE